jgi:hypothetical protein
VPPPEGAGTVRDVTRPSPPLQGSRLWSVVCELGEAAVHRGLWSRTDVDRIKGAIERAAGSLRNEERMKSLWRDAIARMRAALRGSGGGRILTGDFHQAVFDLIKAYLACDVPGMVASEVLGVLLSTQCTIPVLGPPEMMPPEARIAAIEHLADTAYGLISKRDTLDVAGYAEATYLAGVYGRAAMCMASWAQPSGKHSPKELDRFKKLCLNLDELFAHGIAPVFDLPALFAPREILFWVARLSDEMGRSIAETAELYQLHPALRALLERPAWHSMRNDDVNAALQCASDSAERFHAANNLHQGVSPIAPENAERIAMYFLAAGLGPGR